MMRLDAVRAAWARALEWCVVALALVVLAVGCFNSGGDRIVYVTTAGGDPEIAVLDTKTDRVTVVTENLNEDLNPRWSPDGKTVAYASGQTGSLEIRLMKVKGREITRLTNNESDDTVPHWSPDGKQVAFMAERGGRSDLYVKAVEEGVETRISIDSKRNILGGWSPDGQWLVFHTQGPTGEPDEEQGLWLRNPAGVNLVRLSSGNDRDPAWSPDGERIAFVRQAEEDGNDDIFVLRFLGGGGATSDFEISRLTQHTANDNSPNWSPDGLTLAFVSYRDGNGEVYSMTADGSKLRRLTNNEADDLAPDWSSEGRRIAWVSTVYGQSEIFVMNGDGSEQRRLTNNASEDYAPSW